ncbi:MAG: hypothetical protein AVDCRST_MAG87-934 [uncultured Thermomicrobiales bacterium]|uniref:Uncharacterized protein n=1 Tax=uncultured Thermomicrobiales bacterium TaxID=1645740 RepID=A0A6J4UNB4_9BACT|nr:MAG: hypothetical protein AVDCRST_MAG87-934 [uncultured Thermomicrobiales bacterium]
MIAFKHARRTGRLQMGRRTRAASTCLLDSRGEAKAFAPRPALVATRLPMVLVHLFGAQCAMCQGLGCGGCAHTGLR